jgi:cytochrome c553
MADIRDGYRQNVDPDMVDSLKKHKNDKLESVAAYLAALETPGTPCPPAKSRQ